MAKMMEPTNPQNAHNPIAIDWEILDGLVSGDSGLDRYQVSLSLIDSIRSLSSGIRGLVSALLRDEDELVRWEAMKLGLAWFSPSPRIGPLLTGILNDPDGDWLILSDALELAGLQSSKDYTPAVRTLLRHPDAIVRMSAAEALGLLGAPEDLAHVRAAQVVEESTIVIYELQLAAIRLGDPDAVDAVIASLMSLSEESLMNDQCSLLSRLQRVAEDWPPPLLLVRLPEILDACRDVSRRVPGLWSWVDPAVEALEALSELPT